MKLKIKFDREYVSLNQLGAFITGIVLIVSFSTKSNLVQAIVDTNSGAETSGEIAGENISSTELSQDQLENASIIINVGKGMNMSDRDIIIALMTAMQESTLENISHGDDWHFQNMGWGDKSDSVGLFQQRDQAPWTDNGRDRMNAYDASMSFYDQLKLVTDRDSIPEWQAAAEVQRPAKEYEQHYDKWKTLANELLANWKPNQNFSIDAASTKPAIK